MYLLNHTTTIYYNKRTLLVYKHIVELHVILHDSYNPDKMFLSPSFPPAPKPYTGEADFGLVVGVLEPLVDMGT